MHLDEKRRNDETGLGPPEAMTPRDPVATAHRDNTRCFIRHDDHATLDKHTRPLFASAMPFSGNNDRESSGILSHPSRMSRSTKKYHFENRNIAVSKFRESQAPQRSRRRANQRPAALRVTPSPATVANARLSHRNADGARCGNAAATTSARY